MIDDLKGEYKDYLNRANTCDFTQPNRAWMRHSSAHPCFVIEGTSDWTLYVLFDVFFSDKMCQNSFVFNVGWLRLGTYDWLTFYMYFYYEYEEHKKRCIDHTFLNLKHILFSPLFRFPWTL